MGAYQVYFGRVAFECRCLGQCLALHEAFPYELPEKKSKPSFTLNFCDKMVAYIL